MAKPRDCKPWVKSSLVTRPSPSWSQTSSLKLWKRGGGPSGECAFKAPFPMRFLSEAVGQMRRPGGRNAIRWYEEQRCTPHPPMRLPIEPRANGTEALGALSSCGGVPSGSSGFLPTPLDPGRGTSQAWRQSWHACHWTPPARAAPQRLRGCCPWPACCAPAGAAQSQRKELLQEDQ